MEAEATDGYLLGTLVVGEVNDGARALGVAGWGWGIDDAMSTFGGGSSTTVGGAEDDRRRRRGSQRPTQPCR